MWLLAASVAFLPVASQAAITFRVVPGPTPIIPSSVDQQGYVDVVVDASGTSQTESIDGYTATLTVVNPTSGGHITLLTPFAKRTDASDIALNPDVETPQLRQIQSAAGRTIAKLTNGGLTVNGSQINLGDSPEVLGTGGGVMRVPFTVTNASPGDVYQFNLDPARDKTNLLSLTSTNADGNLALPNDGVTNSSITVVPEPASLGLLALGGLLTIRRRRAA